ncbi:MAG: BatA and WFA domain-containing protein [Planctomycetota bacterium]
MNFASPIFFWAFLSLVPLLAIYLLKVQPRRKPTTAYFLWENIFQENKATSLFQRLRDLFSLLLMFLAFAAIVFALTRPDFSGDQQKDLVLVVDVSASMNATDRLSTRLASAKTVARQIVRALNGNQRCSIAVVANESSYLSHLTDNPKELLDAIERIEPTELTSRIEAIQEFSRTMDESSPLTELSGDESSDSQDSRDDAALESNDEFRIILISDGGVGGAIPDDVELIKVGEGGGGNVGLVAADLQRLPSGDNRAGLFFQVHSTFAEAVQAELVVSHETEDNISRLLPLEIQPGKNPADVIEIPGAEDGNWFVRLEMKSEDALSSDDVAYLALAPQRPILVSIDTEDRYFYENSVLAFSQTGGLLSLAETPDQSQIQITQATTSSSDAKLGSSVPDVVLFKPEGESPWWNSLGDEIEVTLPRAIDESHPVIRHLDIASIDFVGARRIEAPAGAEIWVAAEDDTPLIYRTARAGQNVIVVNMDPLVSNFYFSSWFPVLIYSSATHLAGRSESLSSSYPSGQIATIPGVEPGNQSRTTIVKPNGEEFETSASLLGPLDQLGHYQLANRAGQWPTACSLLSPTETAIDNPQLEDTSQPVNRGYSPTNWLTLIALMVILVESILYQRRKVG